MVIILLTLRHFGRTIPYMVKKKKMSSATLENPTRETESEPKDYHKFPIWGLRLPPRYKAAVERLAKKGRRSPTEEVKIAIEAYYESVMGEPFPLPDEIL